MMNSDVACTAKGGGQSLAEFAKQRQEQTNVEKNSETSSPSCNDEQENLADIQHEREKEFLDMFCESVNDLPNDVASSIVEELADRLHHKLSTALEEESRNMPTGLPQDPDEYDDVVVRCLQDDSLQADMAAARDLMLNYVQDRMG